MVEEKKVKAKVIETGKILLVENIKKTLLFVFEKRSLIKQQLPLCSSYNSWEVRNGGVACSLLKLAADKPRPLLQNSLVGSIYVTTYDTYRYLVVNFTVNYPKRGLTTI